MTPPATTHLGLLFLLLGATALHLGGQQPAERGRLRVSSTLRPAAVDDGELELRMTPVVRAVRRARDSVVCIDIVDARSTATTFRGARPDGQGSGVLLDPDGLVITNWHVVYPVTRKGDAFRIQVRLYDGRQRLARLLSFSREHDLAVLQMNLRDGESVQPIALGDSSTLMVGETLIAIGNPQGHAHTVTAGVLSAADRSIRVRSPDGTLTLTGLLQTDAAINQGNSGGALLDITGKLVGINNAMAVGVENIGFAIPVNTVRRVFDEVLVSAANLAGAWSPVYVGLQLAERDGRAVVVAVDPLSPAFRAGLRTGDRLLQAGERVVSTPLDFSRQLFTTDPGSALPLTVQRDGQRRFLRLMPQPRAIGLLRVMVGIDVEEISARGDRDLVRRVAAALTSSPLRPVRLSGVLQVTRIEEDGPAAVLGLVVGDLVLGFEYVNRFGRYDDYLVASRRALTNYLERVRGRDVQIVVFKDGKVQQGPLEVRR